jgi:hypothetical protein
MPCGVRTKSREDEEEVEIDELGVHGVADSEDAPVRHHEGFPALVRRADHF